MNFGISLYCQNFSDWPRYLSGDFSEPPLIPDHEIFLEDLGLADMAEDLGYDSIWSTEHHFTPYELMPSSLHYLTYFAGRTKRISLGTMVVVLPWHDPIRVAEQIAMLDIMLKGRHLTLGFGRGSARVEYDGFRIPMDGSRDRYREAQEIISLALTQERFSYDGEIFQIPEMSIRPQPRSKDLVDNIYVSTTTRGSLDYAAEAGRGLMIIPQKAWPEHIEDLVGYNARRGELGWQPRNPVVGCPMYCASNDAEVQEVLEKYRPNMGYSGTKHYETDEPEHFRGLKGYESYVDRAESLQRGEARSRQDDALVVGTPEVCYEKLKKMQEATRPNEMFGMVRFGGMPVDMAKRSIELFAEEVLPQLHKDPVVDPAVG